MNKFNFREAFERIDAIKARLGEMADNLAADKEREGLTEAEEAEKKQLTRELDILEMKIKANTATVEVRSESDIKSANEQIREHVRNNQRFELRISRAVSGSWNGNASGYANPAASNNPAPVTIHDIVEPLWKKNILSAIGAPLLTGLKGNHQWPVIEAFSATINDEGAALGDTEIPISKLIAKPERIGVAVPVTREALTETDDLITVVATQYMPQAVAALMNKIMFSTKKVTGATNLYGPFIPANLKTSHKLTYATANPSLTDLLNLKAAVLAENVDNEGMCYVMNETTKAALEGTPKWSGANEAVIQNGTINGVPVFATNHVKAGRVLFGCFKYAPQGLFGDMTFIVDPYTLARKNAVDFVLNVDYAITVLRQEAFATLVGADDSSGD